MVLFGVMLMIVIYPVGASVNISLEGFYGLFLYYHGHSLELFHKLECLISYSLS